jgi:hypothetical protein
VCERTKEKQEFDDDDFIPVYNSFIVFVLYPIKRQMDITCLENVCFSKAK